MLKKKFISSMIIGLSAIGFSAHASNNNQDDDNGGFIGLSNLVINDNNLPKVFNSMLETKDIEKLKHWEKEKGFYFPYDGKNVCIVSNFELRNDLGVISPKAMINASTHFGNSGFVPFFTACENLPLLKLLKNSSSRYSPTTMTAVRENYASKNEDEQIYIFNYANKVMDNMKPHQWEQLIDVVTSTEVDYAIRVKALSLLMQWYSKDMPLSAEQQEFRKVFKEYAEKNHNFHLAKNHYLKLEDPINYMFDELVKSSFRNGYGETLTKNPLYQNSPNLTFSKNFYKGKTETPTLAAYVENGKGKDGYNVSYFDANMRFLHNGALMRLLMKHPDFNINKQDVNGDTLLHRMFDYSGMIYLNNNQMAANFVRAMLESGFDPQLLNKNGKTIHDLFEESRQGDGYTDMSNAFMLPKYTN